MAASAWELYNAAKKGLCNGTIKLGVDSFKMGLYKSSSNASTLTLVSAGAVTNEVNTGTYTTGGKALGSPTWTILASARQYRFDSDDVVFSAVSTDMTSIMYAVVKNQSAVPKLLMKSKLSTAIFTVNAGNTLTVQINASGYFSLF